MIIIKDRYPAQTNTSDGDFPNGKAQNDVTEGDGQGTPLEKTWVNDWLGGREKLMHDADIAFNGNIDDQSAAQLVDALDKLYRDEVRSQSLAPVLGADWDFYANGLGWVQNASAAFLIIPISNIPENGKLVSVRALVGGSVGAGGDYSSLPGGMPTLKVEYVDATGTVQAPAPTTTDASTPVGNFNTPHPLTVTLNTPLALDIGSTTLQVYARLDGVIAGYEANKFGITQLTATFTAPGA